MEIVVTFVARLLLVILFLPFSAMDKLVNFGGAVGQASEMFADRTLARIMILCGLGVEIFMSLGVLTGIADRAAAFVLALYCVVTAVLWKRFWATGDFALTGSSRGRDLMWDFWKNLALAGGFLLVAFGTTARSVDTFFADPLGSTHPYTLTEPAS